MEIKSLLEGIVNESRFAFEKVSDGVLKLAEEQEDMEVKLERFPSGAVAVKPLSNQDGFLKQRRTSKLTGICDYVIVIPEKDGVISIIFCELKKRCMHDRIIYASKQIRSTMPLFRYIESAVSVHYNLGSGIKIREFTNLIIFDRGVKNSINKQTTSRSLPIKYRYRRYNMDFCVIIGRLSRITPKNIKVTKKTPKLPRFVKNRQMRLPLKK